MRVAGLLGLLPLMAACGSAPGRLPAAPPAPSPPPSEAPWSAPVEGLSCRARLPERALRGDRLPATVELRVDAATLPAGKRLLDLRPDQAHLLLRRAGAEDADPVRIDFGWEKVLETPALDEEGAPPRTDEERHPDWISLEAAAAKAWEYAFPLARGWDALAPGAWEVRVVIEAPKSDEATSLWSGTLVSPAVPLVLEEPPPRRIRALVPSLLRVRRGEIRGVVDIGFGEGDGEFIDLEPRHGFRMGFRTGTEECFSYGFLDDDWSGFSFGDWFGRHFRGEEGPLDLTLEMEVFEAPWDDVAAMQLVDRRRDGYRTLWRKSFRVEASAAEIEALRR